MSQRGDASSQNVPHVVIVGGGFGGLQAAKRLSNTPVRLTLLDRRNFHLFQPLLYQVATGTLSPANIASPLRRILRKAKNTRVLLGEVTDIDPVARTIEFDGGTLTYDHLVLAAGAGNHYFGHDEWAKFAPGLKSVEDATDMRARILNAFEQAEKTLDPAEREAWLTFVIVGGGPTGVELAGALAEISRRTLKDDFRSIQSKDAQILIVEAGKTVLEVFPADLAAAAKRQVLELGVTLLDETKVTDIQADHVMVETMGESRRIATHAVLWAAGIKPSPLAGILAQNVGVAPMRGRIAVDEFLNIPNHPEIFVIGDVAYATDGEGKQYPGVAPVAMQQGDFVATTILHRNKGRSPKKFKYVDRGTMAVIGRSRAVADVFGRHMSGTIAWFLWLFIHIMFLIQFQNRIMVLMQWFWSYLTYNKSARIITGEQARSLNKTAGSVHNQPPATSPGAAPFASPEEVKQLSERPAAKDKTELATS